MNAHRTEYVWSYLAQSTPLVILDDQELAPKKSRSLKVMRGLLRPYMLNRRTASSDRQESQTNEQDRDVDIEDAAVGEPPLSRSGSRHNP